MGKRGPIPKGEYVGQTAVLSTRITPDLRALLEAEVEKSGKTLSREIEHRLRRSFVEDDKISEAFGSRRNYALMRTISMVLEFWHNPSDLQADWTEDPIAYDQVCKKIDGVLRAMRPTGSSNELSSDDRVLADLSVRSHPAGILDDVQRAAAAIPLGGGRRSRVLSTIKSDLGSLIERSQTPQDNSEICSAGGGQQKGQSDSSVMKTKSRKKSK
ncbi:hypothetical protein [Methylobacterium soli]|uniref:Arc family DNA-binding protein n=1 Tax=Methylobacterium soli TaxID=553447 RepID=A0A6L3SRY4_9HYPH|nr:hypothetical protein [Methylobacterium soli]KAB1075918.1 hypothetical protein F6X53_24105 [Methylobacterium soli]GJE41858.1 hypothetical protein AEGHOMDF_1027 [Methylobacterium soli]